MKQSYENSLKNFLILPSVIVLLCFLFVFFYGVYLSFTDLKLGKPTVNFAGLKNYIYLWKNPLFWKSTKFNFSVNFREIKLNFDGLFIFR